MKVSANIAPSLKRANNTQHAQASFKGKAQNCTSCGSPAHGKGNKLNKLA